VLSAANLNKPGTFDRDAIDMQRLAGLNLFCVLPGPLAPTEALEELFTAARNLNDRLHGALQDEGGEPLTALRAAALREALAESV
jgi:FtsZ-interacting cell division protein ZipA